MKKIVILIFLIVVTAGSQAMAEETSPTTKIAVFAGGCFWCIQSDFDKIDGVISTEVGYTGGHIDNPEYKQVSKGGTGHREAMKVIYDPEIVTYDQLLNAFWHNIDPLDAQGQFCDKGFQYTAAIYVLDDKQKAQAIASRKALDQSGILPAPIVTEIVDASVFYAGEDYHQSYYKKNPWRYKFYRGRCGRDDRLEELWGEKKTH